MSRNARRREPALRPKTKLELNEGYFSLRLVGVAVFIAIAALAFGVAISGLLRTQTGWQQVEASASKTGIAQEFALCYNIGQTETDAKAELDAQDGGTDAAQPSAGASPSEPRYVYIGTATLRARGSVEQWESFLDRLQAQYSGLRIVSFDIAEATYLSADLTQVSDNSITCDLEFYMCAEQEAGA